MLCGGMCVHIMHVWIYFVGLQKLECRDHKIKGKQVKVEFQQLPEFDGGPPPLDDVGDGRSTKLEVSNVPVTVTADILRAFFEGAKSGGCADAVAEVNRINPGVFHVTFHDHKGKKISSNCKVEYRE